MHRNLAAMMERLILPCPGCGTPFESAEWASTPVRDYDREAETGHGWAYFKSDPKSEKIIFGPCGCTLETRANIQIWLHDLETRQAEFEQRTTVTAHP